MENEKNVLIVLANHDFNDEEYETTKSVLEGNGITVRVASLEGGECYGTANTDVESNFMISEVNSDDFDAVVFIGGSGVELYFDEDSVLNLASDFSSSGKLVCAICWAPVILAKAGLLKHKKATVWAGAVKDFDMVDAVYTGQAVTEDGNIITANGPMAAKEFGEAIASKLSEK